MKLSTYSPRNVINASAIKINIANRCHSYQTPDNILSWMLNHFYRYVIGNYSAPYPAIIKITTIDEAMTLLNPNTESINAPQTAPKWLETAIETNTPLYWIDENNPAFIELEQKFLEFLNSKKNSHLEKKILKINAFQALFLYEYEHKLFEIRTDKGLVAHNPMAVQCHLKTKAGEFVEILPLSPCFRQELMFESQMMGHCLGQFADKKQMTGGYGEYYASACENAQLKIFSFRTENNQPKMTISISIDKNEQLFIQEVKGKQNRPPVEKYHSFLLDFLNSLDCQKSSPVDLSHIGIIFSQGSWKKIDDIETVEEKIEAAWQEPELAPRIKNRPLAVDWVVAAKAPHVLNKLENNQYINNLIKFQDH